ncbi:MAG: lysine 2,3-aminomutase [Bdellovibrionales bacterium RIFOXYB1_FULL_37_110]|nr:MAG: lysine 2,3-aminomutase [Bdellovibrionales bacterium RIFOXYC1_FULL_37_79]OFZ57486.1 MAG: lysine 2,3-aminomutase [Bdellovibrionales bacterium RIFOXYB1_FULL_37_110]OFZ62718.1 MAG: lysine 2,3-aminomutase [Bdellovibrionales bacterium RIFOXYD1_FULL_36_51]
MDFREIRTIEDLEKIYPKHILEKFPVSGRGIFEGTKDEDWYDWKWQLKNRITTLPTLKKAINITGNEEKAYDACSKKFKMAITPYYSALMDKDDPECPVRKQSVPNVAEMNILKTDMADPLAEDRDMPVPGLTHRYPDRVLFYASNDCPMLCRHCTRKRKVANDNADTKDKQIEVCLDYIRKTKRIRDVVVSGGDPLCLSNDKIDYILGELRKIEHVEIVRVGTRNPCTLPIRLRDDKLLEIFEKHQPIHVNTHYNHPKECTREALLANTRLSLAGCTVGNQTVLLRNINDNASIMLKLNHLLLLMKVRPYYIFQCDLSEGISHFRTKVSVGLEILEKLRGWTSGLAIPYYVVDSPGGGGKIPLTPNYVVSHDGNKLVLRNYKNVEFTYHEPIN